MIRIESVGHPATHLSHCALEKRTLEQRSWRTVGFDDGASGDFMPSWNLFGQTHYPPRPIEMQEFLNGLSPCFSSCGHEKEEGYGGQQREARSDKDDGETVGGIRVHMKDKGNEGNTERRANISEHVSQPDDRAYLFRHQLYAGVVGSGKCYPPTDAVQEEQECKRFCGSPSGARNAPQGQCRRKSHGSDRGETKAEYHRPPVTPSFQKEARYCRGDGHAQGTGSENHPAHQRGELMN